MLIRVKGFNLLIMTLWKPKKKKGGEGINNSQAKEISWLIKLLLPNND